MEEEGILQTFTELSTTLSTLSVYLYSTDKKKSLAEKMPELETLFKSTDGKFKLLIRHKTSGEVLAQVVIKDPEMRMKIKPGLT